MLSVGDARSQILARCQPLPAEMMPLQPATLGRILAESIASDLDMPPFNKSMMDGYAVRSADLPSGTGVLTVVEEICAGQVPRLPLAPGLCSRIMTGAPIPPGADAVIVVERTRMLDENRVEIAGEPPRAGQNILPRGSEMCRGDVVLPRGSRLTPQAFGVLAAVGRTSVLQVLPPKVAILATGDELVEPGTTPGPGQIRNSNAPMLLAQAARAGAAPLPLGIGRDDPRSLRPLIREGLRTAQVLILSGGVSAGKLDLVPDLLREEGVEAHFHKVHLKPGKPLFFGTWQGEGGLPRLVFGLPGNPVSSFVCFELFIRPALRCLGGYADLDLPSVSAMLAADFSHRSDRPTYHPVGLKLVAEGWQCLPVPWVGSADLRAFLAAHGLAVLPAGDHDFRAGQRLDVLRLEA
jgi:molybdopterin molybdotransferase